VVLLVKKVIADKKTVLTCMPDLIQAVYKTNNQAPVTYRREYLLKPGNISAKRNCGVDYTSNWGNSIVKPLLSTNLLLAPQDMIVLI
jgi:hypothetical protein